MVALYFRMLGELLERRERSVPEGDQAATWTEVHTPEKASDGPSVCLLPTRGGELFVARDNAMSGAGSLAPGSMPRAQSHLVIIC